MNFIQQSFKLLLYGPKNVKLVVELDERKGNEQQFSTTQ